MLASIDLWHRRLGHPNNTTLSFLLQEFCIPSSSAYHDSSLCNACPCGKHVRLPFGTSSTYSTFPFELVHCDIWTSPVPRVWVINIILLFWMTTPIIFGLLLYVQNLMYTPFFLIFHSIFSRTLVCLFALFNATTAVNLTL
jgi:hypothetical protein